LHNVQQNRLNRCTLKVVNDTALRPNPESNVLHFLYVPLPVFSAPDDGGWLLRARQCGENVRLSEILCWIDSHVRLLWDSVVNC
jgi:hypothetical protein